MSDLELGQRVRYNGGYYNNPKKDGTIVEVIQQSGGYPSRYHVRFDGDTNDISPFITCYSLCNLDKI